MRLQAARPAAWRRVRTGGPGPRRRPFAAVPPCLDDWAGVDCLSLSQRFRLSAWHPRLFAAWPPEAVEGLAFMQQALTAATLWLHPSRIRSLRKTRYGSDLLLTLAPVPVQRLKQGGVGAA